MQFTKLSNCILPAFLAAALLASAPASANVLAYAYNRIDHLTINGAPLSTVYDSYWGYTPFSHSGAAITGSGSVVNGSNGSANAAPSCVGTGCPQTDNVFSQAGSFLAHGDAVISNSGIVSGSPQAEQEALVRFDSPAQGSASGGNAFRWALGGGVTQLTVAFDYYALINLVVDAGGGWVASAGQDMRIHLDIWDANGDPATQSKFFTFLDATSSTLLLDAAGTLSDTACATTGCSVSHTFTGLNASYSYDLWLEMNSTAEVTRQVAEPASLALLGLGLIGLGLLRRRHG